MRVAIYTRVSSAKQAEEGLSLAEQRKRCEAFAVARGWAVDEGQVYEERGVSGAKTSRPALDRMMAQVEGGAVDVVVTPVADRLGRSAIHSLELFETFRAAGVQVYTSDGMRLGGDSPSEELMTNVLFSMAQYERSMVSERVRAVTPGKRARGSYNGGPRPYGYDFAPDGAGLLVQRPEEVAVLQRIARDFIGGASLQGIGRALNAEGARGPLGGTWSVRAVCDRLDNPLYAGQVGGGADGKQEPVWDAGTWQRIRDLRDAHAQRSGTRKAGRRPHTHLLGDGLLRCECGASLYPRKDTQSGRDTYRCRGRDERTHDCAMPPIPRAELDAAIRDYLAGQVFAPGEAERSLRADMERRAREAVKAAQGADAQVRKYEARLKNARNLWVDGDMPADEYREIKADTETELTAARGLAAQHRRTAEALRVPSEALIDAVEAIRRVVRTEATAATVAAQRAAIERLFLRFDVVTAAADAADPAEFPGTPAFNFTPHRQDAWRVFLIPQPKPELVERFGADPLDGLTNLYVTA